MSSWIADLLLGATNRRTGRVTRKARFLKPRRLSAAAIETLERRVLLSISPPVVSTSPATAISTTAATLHGSVNPESSTAAVRFEYSTSSALTPSVTTTVGSGFTFPTGVAVDASGDVFVADQSKNTVKEVLPNGTIKTIGTKFNVPTGLAVDASGDVFVANEGNNAVTEVLANGTMKTISTKFSVPSGVAVDASGDVFVADNFNNAVKEVLPNGTIKIVGSGFNTPGGVAVDASGDVFVADQGNNAVKEILPNHTIKTLSTKFNGPQDVAVDASGDVFVADTSNSAVKEILPNGTIKTVGSGYNFPQGVAVDAAGDVFVADSVNKRVVEVAPRTVAATPSPLTGSTAQSVSGAVTGLSPGTTYYFRAVAASAGGTVVGTTDSFTTLPVLKAATFNATEGASFSGTVATITAGTTTGDTATINWGDGTTTSGKIVTHAGGGFAVTGSHTYAEEGTHSVKVTLATTGGGKATVNSAAKIADAALVPIALTIAPTQGVVFSGNVDTFTDADPNGTVADFTATINWGDGQTTAGTIAIDPSGGFEVLGSHNYAAAGTEPVVVSIADSGGSKATANSTANISPGQ